MSLLVMAIAAAAGLAAAVYAHYRIPRYTRSRAGAAVTHAVLAAVGIAFGYVGARDYGAGSAYPLLAFLAGFGLVHVPAAIILLLKRARHEPKS